MKHPSEKFELELTDGKREVVERVGPGAVGAVYRSASTWYRVYTADMPLKARHALRAEINASKAGFATLSDFWQESGTGWHIARYQSRHAQRTLREIQVAGEVRAGLAGVAAMLRALPTWWAAFPTAVLATPSDVLFTDQGEACLLPWADPGPLSIEHLYLEPDHVDYLAPELLRSSAASDPSQQEPIDRFAIGVALLECFFESDAYADPCEAIERAAVGHSARRANWRDSLPFWIEEVKQTENVIAVARQLAACRPADRMRFNLPELADWLLKCSEGMEPLAAFREAAVESKQRALQLLEKLRLEHESYDLLVEGAHLAWQVNSELKAMFLYERAIELDRSRPQAFQGQFDVIAFTRGHPHLPLSMEYANNVEFALQLDECIRRDFDQLEALAGHEARKRENAMAEHYLWRGKKISTFFETAKQFVREHVYDRQRQFLAWKLVLRLVYCEALLEQGHSDQAIQIFDEILNDIQKYAGKPQLAAEVRRANEYAKALRPRLIGSKSAKASSPQTT